jgi:hypothetical protein
MSYFWTDKRMIHYHPDHPLAKSANPNFMSPVSSLPKPDIAGTRAITEMDLRPLTATPSEQHDCALKDMTATPGTMYTCGMCGAMWVAIGTSKRIKWRRRYG